MVTLRRFTKTDWLGYGGCESFNDGTPPFIGFVKVTECLRHREGTPAIVDEEYVVLADKTTFHVLNEDDEFEIDFSSFNNLNDNMTDYELQMILEHARKI